MKNIDLAESVPELTDLLKLAGKENVLLTTAEGRQFVLAEIDDFDKEIALVRENAELMKLLEHRSKDSRTVSLRKVREQLKLN